MDPDVDGLHRTLVQNAPDAIVYADATGHIFFWNTGAERIFGFSSLGKRTAQRRLRVLGLPPRTWKAPHIRNSLNLVVCEQRQKRLQRSRRMAYGPDRRVHRRVILKSKWPAVRRRVAQSILCNTAPLCMAM